MEWRVVEEFPTYSVSEAGQVKRTGDGRFRASNKLVKGSPDAYGYTQHGFWRDGKHVNRKAYQLVASAFIGPRPSPKHEICHNDGSRTNDHWTNLRWDTRAGNEADKRKTGTDNAGERHGSAKLTAQEARQIAELYRSGGLSQREIAERFAVHQVTVSMIVRGKLWARTIGELYLPSVA